MTPILRLTNRGLLRESGRGLLANIKSGSRYLEVCVEHSLAKMPGSVFCCFENTGTYVNTFGALCYDRVFLFVIVYFRLRLRVCPSAGLTVPVPTVRVRARTNCFVNASGSPADLFFLLILFFIFVRFVVAWLSTGCCVLSLDSKGVERAARTLRRSLGTDVEVNVPPPLLRSKLKVRTCLSYLFIFLFVALLACC